MTEETLLLSEIPVRNQSNGDKITSIHCWNIKQFVIWNGEGFVEWSSVCEERLWYLSCLHPSAMLIVVQDQFELWSIHESERWHYSNYWSIRAEWISRAGQNCDSCNKHLLTDLTEQCTYLSNLVLVMKSAMHSNTHALRTHNIKIIYIKNIVSNDFVWPCLKRKQPMDLPLCCVHYLHI